MYVSMSAFLEVDDRLHVRYVVLEAVTVEGPRGMPCATSSGLKLGGRCKWDRRCLAGPQISVSTGPGSISFTDIPVAVQVDGHRFAPPPHRANLLAQ